MENYNNKKLICFSPEKQWWAEVSNMRNDAASVNRSKQARQCQS